MAAQVPRAALLRGPRPRRLLQQLVRIFDRVVDLGAGLEISAGLRRVGLNL